MGRVCQERAGYVIGEVLGRGGCGTVYKATQTVLDRPVAIKFLRQDRAVSRQGLERLQGESVSLAQLQHPHLLSVIRGFKLLAHK
jgi:serine/threonine-protein kinase